MTLEERRKICEAYESMGKPDFSIVVSRVYEDENGEEVDREEILRKSFESASEANAYVKREYAPLEWESGWCVTEPQQNTDGGYDFLFIQTTGFTYDPDAEDDDGTKVDEGRFEGEEIVSDWN